MKKDLFEGIDSLNDRLFATSLYSLIVGKDAGFKLRASKKEMSALSEVLKATKTLHEELNKEDATLISISSKLHEKNLKAIEFERLFGIRWPL